MQTDRGGKSGDSPSVVIVEQTCAVVNQCSTPDRRPQVRHLQERQASRGKGGGGKYLTAWENSWELRTNSGPDHCARLPLTAPAFARSVALDLRLKFQVRIGGRDHQPAVLRQPPARDRMRSEISAIGQEFDPMGRQAWPFRCN